MDIKKETENHYQYLDRILPEFFKAVGTRNGAEDAIGITSAHGDKGGQYKSMWAAHGISYNKGMAVYLLTYCAPFSQESRNTTVGWVPPVEWVIENFHRFAEHLPD